MATWGIDLGTANTVVYDPGTGVLHDEPSAVVCRPRGRREPAVIALGRDAAELDGRVGAGVEVERPVRDGVVTDLDTARRYLHEVLARVAPGWWRQRVARPRAVLGVPLGATALERRALIEVAQEAGVRRPVSLGETVAAALGCGVDPLDGRVHLVVDIGGGTAEIAAFCSGAVVAHRSCRQAGEAMTRAVQQRLRERHGLIVAEPGAEAVKIAAGAGADGAVASGRDAGSGRPRLMTVRPDEVAEAVAPVLDAIIGTLASCLDDLPPRGVGDVLAEGALLTGGGSLTCGVAGRLETALGVPVKPADAPLTCVAEGLAAAARRGDVLAAHGL